MHAMKAYLPPLARLLMCGLFIWDGFLQLRDPSGTAKYFANVHIQFPMSRFGFLSLSIFSLDWAS